MGLMSPGTTRLPHLRVLLLDTCGVRLHCVLYFLVFQKPAINKQVIVFNMSPERKKLSKGQAIHRRRELAQQREQVPASSVTETTGVVDSKREELRKISEGLKLKTLDLTERVTLMFKTIWLKKEVGEINEATRREQLLAFDKEAKQRWPETYKWFFEEKLPDGETRAFKTRQEVVPDQQRQGRQLKP